MRIEFFVDKAALWRWRLRAANGKIIADSGEGYASRNNVKRAVENVIEEIRDRRVLPERWLNSDETDTEKG